MPKWWILGSPVRRGDDQPVSVEALRAEEHAGASRQDLGTPREPPVTPWRTHKTLDGDAVGGFNLAKLVGLMFVAAPNG